MIFCSRFLEVSLIPPFILCLCGMIFFFCIALYDQVFDNALIGADIMDNPRTMVTRLNQILEQTLEGVSSKEAPAKKK